MIKVKKQAETYTIIMATKTMRGKTQLSNKQLKDWSQSELKFYIERTLLNPKNYKTLVGIFDHTIEELKELVKDAAPKVAKPKKAKAKNEDSEEQN
ncbi:MAG: hypothetical protein ACXQTI_10865 [Candidatus Nezhaarchaeales archaeon]